MKSKLIPLLLVLCMVGCNSSSDDNTPANNSPVAPLPPVITDENLAIPDNLAATQYNILFLGNSHVGGMASLVQMLFEVGAPQKNIGKLSTSQGGFLSERLEDGRSVDVLKSNAWSHVIFQAQKYSQSGQFDYPTIGAQTWIQMAKSQDATPILFPEHPQRGDSLEGQKVHDLHVSIANKQSSCLAPVGLVWDRVIRLRPNLVLHHADGNHASNTGKFLSALVFYETISGFSADLVPFIDSIDIDSSTQDLFGQITSEVISENPPCNY